MAAPPVTVDAFYELVRRSAVVTPKRLDDYIAMGVLNVWVIEPHARRGYVYNSVGFIEAKDGMLCAANSEIAVPLADIFES